MGKGTSCHGKGSSFDLKDDPFDRIEDYAGAFKRPTDHSSSAWKRSRARKMRETHQIPANATTV